MYLLWSLPLLLQGVINGDAQVLLPVTICFLRSVCLSTWSVAAYSLLSDFSFNCSSLQAG